MGRGRGKGKKRTFTANNDDQGSGEDQKNPAHRRRGRPQKPSKKNGVVEDEKEVLEKIEENSSNESKGIVLNDDSETNHGRKRSRSAEAEENIDSLEEENEEKTGKNIEKTKISVGFRQIGSRRKNKPRRAAEVGVECN